MRRRQKRSLKRNRTKRRIVAVPKRKEGRRTMNRGDRYVKKLGKISKNLT